MRRILATLQWGLIGALVLPLIVAFPINGGDATWVSQSARALVQCVRDDVWRSCPGTFQFGWLQHAPAMFLAWKGFGDDAIVAVLTGLNFAAAVWLVNRILKHFRQSEAMSAVSLLFLIAGPLYAFSVYSFSEMLVIALIVALLFSLFECRSSLMVVILTFLIASSRETALLLVIPLGGAVIINETDSVKRFISRMIPVVTGSLAGLVAVLYFNQWKYGSWSNVTYSDPLLRVPGIQLKIKNAFAVWVSPSGGVTPVWVMGTLVAVVVPVVLISRWRMSTRRSLVAVCLVGTLALQTMLLSAWFAPFGWVTWGPRLIMPAVAGVGIAVLLLFESVVRELLERATQHLAIIAVVTILVIASGLPNLGFILDRSATLAWFTPPLSPSCPASANIWNDKTYYLNCALDYAPWQLGRTLWDSGLHQVTQRWAMLYSLLIVLLVGRVVWGVHAERRATITSPAAIEGKRDKSLSMG